MHYGPGLISVDIRGELNEINDREKSATESVGVTSRTDGRF